MSEYNGWTNYETWRIMLEVLDGMTLEDFGFRPNEGAATEDIMDDLSNAIESFVVEHTTINVPDGIALNLMLSFLDKVNWLEIADHLILDWTGSDQV